MSTCNICGNEILFRWDEGSRRPIPIHVNGGWCTGGSGESKSGSTRSCFESVKNYLDPNARCPICDASVFFYRSPNNGRVFFDDVGWPWPKHPCTDKYKGGDDKILLPVNSRFKFNFKSREGASLDVFLLDQIIEGADEILVQVSKVDRSARLVVAISREYLGSSPVEIADIKEAPSFVLPHNRVPGGEFELSFMCARLQLVTVLVGKERANNG